MVEVHKDLLKAETLSMLIYEREQDPDLSRGTEAREEDLGPDLAQEKEEEDREAETGADGLGLDLGTGIAIEAEHPGREEIAKWVTILMIPPALQIRHSRTIKDQHSTTETWRKSPNLDKTNKVGSTVLISDHHLTRQVEMGLISAPPTLALPKDPLGIRSALVEWIWVVEVSIKGLVKDLTKGL